MWRIVLKILVIYFFTTICACKKTDSKCSNKLLQDFLKNKYYPVKVDEKKDTIEIIFGPKVAMIANRERINALVQKSIYDTYLFKKGCETLPLFYTVTIYDDSLYRQIFTTTYNQENLKHLLLFQEHFVNTAHIQNYLFTHMNAYDYTEQDALMKESFKMVSDETDWEWEVENFVDLCYKYIDEKEAGEKKGKYRHMLRYYQLVLQEAKFKEAPKKELEEVVSYVFDYGEKIDKHRKSTQL